MSFFCFLLVLCQNVYADEAEERASRFVKNLGGVVSAAPGVPVSLVDLKWTAVTDEDLRKLEAFQHVRTIRLGMTHVTDAGLKHLGTLKDLEDLNLEATEVTDAGLKDLAALTQLKYLDLSNTRVEGTGFKHLASLGLISVRLSDAAVTDDGLKAIGKIQTLRELELKFDPQVTDEGLKHLALLKHLHKLDIGSNPLGDGALKQVASITELKWFAFAGTHVTDAGLAELAPLQNLEDLVIGGNPGVTDQGLQRLVVLRNLKRLGVKGSRVTSAGVAKLKKAVPGCEIGPLRDNEDE